MKKSFFSNLFDTAITLILWIYFIFGFAVFFAPRYAAAYFFARNREKSFQAINSGFFRTFFRLVKAITPGVSISVDKKISELRSSIIVSNHESYLDPILLIANFQRQKTVVKSVFFKVPVFGFLLRHSGYIPASAKNKMNSLLSRFLESSGEYFNDGGVLFVFPEGTRSRDGSLGLFNESAFKLARRFSVPLDVIVMRNTKRLFAPGSFCFNTRDSFVISIEYAGRIDVKKSGISEAVSLAKEMMIKKLETPL